MLEKPVFYKPGIWEEHLARLHLGQPTIKSNTTLRELLRVQAQAEDNSLDADQPGDIPIDDGEGT